MKSTRLITKMDTLCNLQAARLLIDDLNDWTQRVNARSADGWEVEPTSAAARCWCVAGALHATAPYRGAPVDTWAFINRHQTPQIKTLTSINDIFGHTAVKRELDRLIKICLKELDRDNV